MSSTPLSCCIVGADTLLLQCAEIWRDAGHELRAVVTAERRLVAWCRDNGVDVVAPGADLGARLAQVPAFDFLFAITHLELLPADVLSLPRRAAINFHDGPLPRYAGLNATSWALMAREPSHGITWHTITAGIDAGDILLQAPVAIEPDDTALTLNARCFETAIATFKDLVARLGAGTLSPQPQDGVGRTYFGRNKRPARAGVVDWNAPADEIAALVRALDFGGYRNPLLQVKALVGDGAVVIGKARPVDTAVSGVPGTVLEVRPDHLVVQAGGRALELRDLATVEGRPFEPGELASAYALVVGSRLPVVDAEQAERLTGLASGAARSEAHWLQRLADLDPSPVPWAEAIAEPASRAVGSSTVDLPDLGGVDAAVAACVAFLARFFSRERVDVAYGETELAARVRGFSGVFSSRVPLCPRLDPGGDFAAARAVVEAELRVARQHGTFPRDLVARHPELAAHRRHGWLAACPVAVEVVASLDGAANDGRPADGDAALTFAVAADGRHARLTWQAATLSDARAARLRAQLQQFLAGLAEAPDRRLAEQPLMDSAERDRVLHGFNATGRGGPAAACVHAQFRAQAARTPAAIAVRARGKTMTYAELDARSDRLAARLVAEGVGPDALVGVFMQRSLELPVALLGILKAGGAYVPLDPDYPPDRVAAMAQDAGLRAAVVDAECRSRFPGAGTTLIDVTKDAAGASLPLADAAEPGHLAYVIFTSGSTGRPKGVMVQHGNVTNFFAGMDDRLGTQRGVWLAVTSLSFDISVLELLWTLTRGFEVVVYAGPEALTAASGTGQAAGPALARAARPLSFSLFYFSSDESEGLSDKYQLLLDGARFGDQHGFEAVWTPERHFHAFGGLYPNPSVASAAIAAVTERIKIRAGSVVLPLHHPIRIAEEWALVDNISKGRVGISFAAGWQPDDFVLRPDTFAERKKVMFDGIETVKRLWRGEAVTFKGPRGNDVDVRTLPRPVQRELDTWVTIAGNPDTYVEAGRKGQRVLTHLLGQSVEELAEKLQLYRAAWREAAHPGRPHVTLMLHTFVGDDDATVKETVRAPMKDYLKSAMDLVKRAAWSFPTFKDRVQAGGQSMDQVFAAGLTDDETEALLEHAFERYYEGSGLFGTAATCMAMVRRLKELEIDELACLIDFGVPSPLVLAHLQQLLLLKQASDAETTAAQEALAADDSSIPALLERHRVTHFQCTPSMASMLLMEDRGKEALRRVDKMLVGGEALPAGLARELTGLVRGELWNMYGPTETTVWSTCARIDADAAARGEIGIGTPLPNQRLYVLDAGQQPLPVGVAGELWIAGHGVVRGYLGRDDLTRERFVEDPFLAPTAAGRPERMYRTGDLAAWTEAGTLQFLGRIDHQVKVRGYRIELGEIESALRAHASVREAVVVAREDTPGDKRLVAYVLPQNEVAGCRADTLRDHLRQTLPEFMVPAHVVQLKQLPLTPNKKIDRKALPAPDQTALPRSTPFEAAGNELEATIAEVWKTALAVERVGANDNFFDLGGHSLLAVKVHREVQAAVGRQFSITALFQFPTVRTLAASLSGAGQANERVEQSEVRGEARRASLLAQRQRVRPRG